MPACRSLPSHRLLVSREKLGILGQDMCKEVSLIFLHTLSHLTLLITSSGSLYPHPRMETEAHKRAYSVCLLASFGAEWNGHLNHTLQAFSHWFPSSLWMGRASPSQKAQLDQPLGLTVNHVTPKALCRAASGRERYRILHSPSRN